MVISYIIILKHLNVKIWQQYGFMSRQSVRSKFSHDHSNIQTSAEELIKGVHVFDDNSEIMLLFSHENLCCGCLQGLL